MSPKAHACASRSLKEASIDRALTVQNLSAAHDLAHDGPPCSDDADPDFQELITELARSPLTPLSQAVCNSVGRQQLIPVPQSSTDCFFVPDKMAALQYYGLRSSPASTNKRKRQYSSTGDLAHLSSKFSWETDSSGDSERTTSANKLPASSIKRAASSSQTCTLMPFSLVKAFPSQDMLSLSDVNRRIQSVADGEGTPSFQSQESVNSMCDTFLPGNTPLSRSPFRPQITVVKAVTAPLPLPLPETSPPFAFKTGSEFH